MSAAIINPYLISGAAGLVGAALILIILNRRIGYDRKLLFACYIFAVVGMFLGAHLLFFITGLPTFASTYGSMIYDVASFLDAIFNAASGMVFYGGLFGAVLGIMIFCRISRLNIRSYLNICVCAFPMMHGCGRIGCALGGCCYGIEYHGFLAMQYTPDHINPGISDHIADFPRFPVQPLEAVLEFIICALLIIIYLKTKDRYSLTAIYFFAYGIIRFCDEFLRGDTIRGIWGPFSTSQWIALGCILGTVLYFLLQKSKSRTARL